jgi:hypothetical protein
MAHLAEIDETNTVIQVIVVDNNELLVDGIESEAKGIEFCQSLFGGSWVQTSYNHNFRKQYASIDYTYDAVNDVFISPQPYLSWTLDENFDWQAPTPRPVGGVWYWDEETLGWVELDV